MSAADRLTPEQIAAEFGSDGQNTLDRLAHHGYVIVHPDDVPTARTLALQTIAPYQWGRLLESRDYGDGWDACRESIFGDPQQ